MVPIADGLCVFRESPDELSVAEIRSTATAIGKFEKSLTRQSEAEQADINFIVKQFGLTGQLPQGLAAPSFGDYEDVFDFQSAMNVVRQATETFNALPADVRSRFDNQEQKFLEFCTAERDGKLVNLEEMRKFGLAVPEKAPEPVPAPMKVEVVNAAPKAKKGQEEA